MIRVSFVVLLVAAAAGCAKTTTGQSGAAAGVAGKPSSGPNIALDPALVVATVNGRKITAAELDAKIKPELSKATQEFVEKMHETRENGLQEMVADQLVELESKARNMTKEALVTAEIEAKAKQPTEQDLVNAYEKFVKPRSPIPYEQVKPQIMQQLMQQEQAMRAKAFFDELNAKYKVALSLPPAEVPRVDVAATGPAKGPDKAPVTIVEFSDFQCPFCSRAKATVDEVVASYGDKVKLVFRHYPLPFHPLAQKAAEASLCANDQGKFWAMHDAMFADQEKLGVPELKATARTLGIDGDKFDKCLDSNEKAPIVKKDSEEGGAAGVNGTPAFFINGRPLTGAQPAEAFKAAIDAELAKVAAK